MTTPRTAGLLAELAGEPAAGDGRALAQRLVEDCAAALSITGVSLAVMGEKSPAAILAVTNGPARVIEELQCTVGEGPGVDCLASGRTVLQPDLGRTGPPRWPEFAAGALQTGIQAVFAFPLRVGAIRLGALDLCRHSPGGLDDDALADALAFADAATTMLLNLQAVASGSDSLVALAEDRAEIHQATGMVSVQASATLADALTLLRARAFAAERPILDIAIDVIARRMRIEP